MIKSLIMNSISGLVGSCQAEQWLLDEIRALSRERSSPEPDPNLTADFACYNIATQPTSFDFSPWFVNAEMVRVREGTPAPLKVGFCSDHHGNLEFAKDYQKMMVENVIRPMLKLLGAVEDKRAVYGKNHKVIAYRKIVEAARGGEPVPVFKAPFQRPEYAGVVTITLRETEHLDERNSDLPVWLNFADWLRAKGERVVIVRDTSHASEEVPGHESAPSASSNLHVRMALYEQAKCNFFVSNGPWNLALFSQRPWYAFINANEDDICNLPDSWREYHGLEVGGQFPWAGPKQRVVWEHESLAKLMGIWETF